MKVVFLIQDCTTVGGTERTTCCIANAMARRGHDVAIVSVYATRGEPFFPIDRSVRFVRLSEVNYSLRMSAPERLRHMITEAGLAKQCRELRAADVIIAQKFFAAAIAVRAGFGPKTITGDHYAYRMYGRITTLLRNRIYSRVRAVAVLTEENALAYRQHGFRHVAVIPNMLPIEPVERQAGPKQEIVAVGRLVHDKGFDTLIRAAAQIREELRGWHITIYGQGPEHDALERLIKEKGLEETVELHSPVRDIATVYAGAAFGVMPSRLEGFPMVLLEAAAASLPMVAFDCPTGPGTILRDGGGIIVPDQDETALAKAIARMAGSEPLRAEMADATARIRNQYSEQQIYDLWMKAIEEI